MASEYVLEYGDYGDYSTNLGFIEEKIENILDKIVNCNYIPKEHENTGTETRNQTMNKVVDRKSVCGIEHADLKEAMKYVQAGFQNASKISNSLKFKP